MEEQQHRFDSSVSRFFSTMSSSFARLHHHVPMYGEVAIFGPAAQSLGESERTEAQSRPFDSKTACFAIDDKELYIKIQDKADVRVTVTTEWVGHVFYHAGGRSWTSRTSHGGDFRTKPAINQLTPGNVV